MVHVAEIHAHGALLAAVGAERSARKQANILESSIVIVVVEIIRTRIVGYVQVRPTVIIVVTPHALHAEVVLGIVDSSCFGNILESAVAPVAEEEIGFARQSPGTA